MSIPIGVGAFLKIRSSAERRAMMPRIISLSGGADKRVIVREVLYWNEIQPTETGGYQWSTMDELVKDCADFGVEILAILSHPPAWATAPGGGLQDSYLCPPYADLVTAGGTSALTAYTNYCKAVVARYGENGSFWAQNPSIQYTPITVFEIWNEPYLPNTARRWNGTSAVDVGCSPTDYAQIYGAAYTAIHSVQPNAEVMAAAGLATSLGDLFLKPFLAALTTSVDLLSVHVYVENYYPASLDFGRNATHTAGEAKRNSTTWGQLTDVRLTCIEAGHPTLPIWLTETGWATITATYPFGMGTTALQAEQQQAARYTDMFNNLRSNENTIQGLFIFCYNNPWSPDQPGQTGYGATNIECFLGLYHTDGVNEYDGATCSPKPAVAAIETETAKGLY